MGLYTWGKTTNLALGYGQFSHSADQNRARQVVFPNGEVPAAISCSAFHTVCVCESGYVAVWGFGQGHRLATGDAQSRVDPVLLGSGRFSGVPITKALASVDNSMFLDAEGHAYLAGSNKFGQCGRSLHVDVCKVPTIVKHLTSPCCDIAIGDKHCMVVDADTQMVLAWGDNSAGHGSPSHSVALVKSNLPIIPRAPRGRVPGLQALAQCQLARSDVHIGSIMKTTYELCVADALPCGFVRFPLLVDYCIVTFLCNILLLYAKSPDTVIRLLKCLAPLLRHVVARRERGELSLYYQGLYDRPADILNTLLSQEDAVQHMVSHMAVLRHEEEGAEAATTVVEEKSKESGGRATSAAVGGSLDSLEHRQQKRLDAVVRKQEVLTEGVRRKSIGGGGGGNRPEWKEVQTVQAKAARENQPKSPSSASRSRAGSGCMSSPRLRSTSNISDSGPQPRTPTLGDFIFTGTRVSPPQAHARSCPWASSPRRSEARLSEVIEEQRASSSSSSSSASARLPNDRCSWGMDVTPGVRRPSALTAVMEEERAAREAVRLVEEFERSEREARRLAAIEEAAALQRHQEDHPRRQRRPQGHGRHGKGKGRGKGRWVEDPLRAPTDLDVVETATAVRKFYTTWLGTYGPPEKIELCDPEGSLVCIYAQRDAALLAVDWMHQSRPVVAGTRGNARDGQVIATLASNRRELHTVDGRKIYSYEGVLPFTVTNGQLSDSRVTMIICLENLPPETTCEEVYAVVGRFSRSVYIPSETQAEGKVMCSFRSSGEAHLFMAAVNYAWGPSITPLLSMARNHYRALDVLLNITRERLDADRTSNMDSICSNDGSSTTRSNLDESVRCPPSSNRSTPRPAPMLIPPAAFQDPIGNCLVFNPFAVHALSRAYEMLAGWYPPGSLTLVKPDTIGRHHLNAHSRQGHMADAMNRSTLTQ
ncbi:regulator of chromosome condensation, putative [Perkinsus marinus ATCC 50983]|uniref:Regulator of chromosome condensation, putative n=1 Tax=Perkinsus marinus (strain ATCC 50983 / TXsc) TaxID=423536 RepID=C5LDF6_PERM5|nr:regulator of chromosome condensation, putative [Perkinsus marinus ATCC 50983]EER05288.1 regulator of chromosome condensation, putative [Perkinsus marinus ATCC 50983]|eukprot:XP_002773472.1 regulator of chromosome condensation, putative [Perkinsus marinus ATCC 50983]